MWYFTWTLGLFAAAIFAVVNAMWLEVQQDNVLLPGQTDADSAPEGKRAADA